MQGAATAQTLKERRKMNHHNGNGTQPGRLYVGNLPYDFSDDDLAQVFTEQGYKVHAPKMIVDRETGKSKGFGFIEVQPPELANQAVEALDGTDVGGRTMRVSIARPREPRRD